MRRNQLIQIGILAVALISGYKFIESLIAVIITALFQFSDRFNGSMSFILEYGVFLVVYFAGFYLLIRYNKQLADYIERQGNTPEDADTNTIQLRVDRQALLYVVVIALCVITLIEEIPVLIISVYNYFKKDVGGIPGQSVSDLNFKTAAIRFVFTIIILFCANPISSWFSRQVNTGETAIETTAAEKGDLNQQS